MNANVQSLAFPIGSIPNQVMVSSHDLATIYALQGELRTCIFALRGAFVQHVDLDKIPSASWFWQRAEAATDELDVAITKAIGLD